MCKIFILSLLGTFLLMTNGENPDEIKSDRYEIGTEEKLIFADDDYLQVANPDVAGPIKLTWMQAVNFCISQDKKLASADTADELKAIVEKINEKGLLGEDFWLSGRKVFGTWFWEGTGKGITNLRWNKGQPDNLNGFENCLLMKGNLKWDDADCYKKAFIICEDK